VGGFVLRIYFHDHPPAHVHIFRGGAHVVISLEGDIVRIDGDMTVANRRRARRIVLGLKDELSALWEKSQG
jgi:hypothetical protein